MINLLYYSHTAVPAHLEELETLGLLERDEQVLVALDGVLLDADNRRMGGPTLHDYCLLTTLRVLLWGRDYGGHICYAFPLTELTTVQGQGLDPLHAQIALTFIATDDETGETDEQRFTLTLLPIANLQAGQALLRSAADAARELVAMGVSAREAGPEILSVLGEQIYGHVDGLRPGESPYRWPGAPTQTLTPVPGFYQDIASLPPEKIYTASRLARSAWDTIRRSIRDADLPFELNSSGLRDLTDAVRAVNELMHTVATNPSAQQMAMAFLNRNNQRAPESAAAPAAPAAPVSPATPTVQPAAAAAADSYHKIPLRRREDDEPAPKSPTSATQKPQAVQPNTSAAPPSPPDRREIPLHRRGPTSSSSRPHNRTPISISGSGDADVDDAR